MKVLFFTHVSGLYGANLSMLQLINELINTYNIECAVAFPSESGGVLEEKLNELNVKGYEYHFFSWYTGKVFYANPIKTIKRVLSYIIKNKIIFNVKNLLYLKGVQAIIDDFQPDIIHLNSSVVDIGERAAYRNNIPCVWHIREFGKQDYGLYFAKSTQYVRKHFGRAAKVIVISNAIKNSYSRYLKSAHVQLIYDGLPIVPVEKEKHLGINFVCVGLIGKQKNQIEILKALKSLKKQNVSDEIKVFFVGGGDEEYLTSLKEFTKDNNLTECVSFCDYQKDIFQVLARMDVGIIPSKKEALGRVTIEYMMANMPVIGANSGATPELIQHGENGYLYYSGNYDELAQYMKLYITDRQLLKLHGARALKRAKKFNISDAASKVFRIYLKVLQ